MVKTEWQYSDSCSLLLNVDDNSSQEDIEAEIEYWMQEIRLFSIDGEDRAAIMQAINAMTQLLH